MAAFIGGEFAPDHAPKVRADSEEVPTLAWLEERASLARSIPMLPSKKATVPVPTIVQGEYVGILVENPCFDRAEICLLYTSPSPRDKRQSRMPSSA